MLRTFLRVKEVTLRILQPVFLEISIRKQQKTITMPSHFPMINGRSEINVSYEFHMSNKNPSFQICVVLCLKGIKKLAGWKEVNLKNIKKQVTVHIEDHLSNCPDKNSIINFQLTYTTSPFEFVALDLISQQEIHLMNTMLQISEIEQQKRIAQEQTKQLDIQYKKLIQQNQQLYQEIQHLDSQQSDTQNGWKREILIQQSKQNESLIKLENQKHKISQILDLVLESGDPQLINIVQNQIQNFNFSPYQPIDQQSNFSI